MYLNILFTRGSFSRRTCSLSATACFTFMQLLHIHSHLANTTSPAQLAAGTARRLGRTSVVAAEGEDDLDTSPCITIPLHYQQSVE